MQLPKNQSLNMMQQQWASILDPLLANPSNSSLILPNVLLSNGTTVVNHKLGQALQGWSIVRQRGLASIYDQQDSNQTPALTLVLVSNAAVSVDLEVF